MKGTQVASVLEVTEVQSSGLVGKGSEAKEGWRWVLFSGEILTHPPVWRTPSGDWKAGPAG